MSLSLACLALLLSPAEPGPAQYARPELLIEASELARPGAARDFVILDARGKGNYLEGHVPGAVWINQLAWDKAFAESQDEKEWARRLGALGIDTGTRVILYDNNRSKDAARLWWILRYWGVRDVRLLNGGWHAWQEAGGQVEKTDNKPHPVEPRLLPQRGRLATRKQILDALKKKPQ